MDDAEPKLSIIELVLHSHPLLLLCYLTVTISGLILLFLIGRSLFRNKNEKNDFRRWIPFPAIISIVGVSHWFIQIKELIDHSLWTGEGLITAVSEVMILVFYGSTVSTLLFLLSIPAAGIFHKENRPNEAVDSTASRVILPAGGASPPKTQEVRHGKL